MNYDNVDIIDLILDDHQPLKQLIKTMKGDAELDEKFIAFQEFAPLLVMHSKPEEQTVYMRMKKVSEGRESGFEGDVEHGLADQLLEEIKRTKDEDVWMAKVKVLAELVEHHIKEEEKEMLPLFKKISEAQERKNLAQEFLDLKEELGEQSGEDSPSESSASLLAKKKKKSATINHSKQH